MVGFRRRAATAPAEAPREKPEIQEDGQDAAVQEVMKDNLDLMLDIVLRVQRDPEFAKSIYKDCPRLQALLKLHPDLRPVFEDPNLVRINFEKVYRDAGGLLPGDEPPKKSLKQRIALRLAPIVNHPLFKIFKWLLIIKKIISCLNPMKGFGAIKSFFFPVEDLDAIDADANADGNPAHKETKLALNKAADHMEDPEVQEKMDAIMEDPDSLQEAIENDKELRALRDSDPLCAELMTTPEGMRILVEPDNLRALGECPDLIEQDFAETNRLSAPDVGTERAGQVGAVFEATDVGLSEDVPELEAEAREADYDEVAEEEGEEDMFDDMEIDERREPHVGEAEVEEEDFMFDDMEIEREDDGGGRSAQKPGGKGQQKGDQKKSQENREGGRFSGWLEAGATAVGGAFVQDFLGTGDGLIGMSLDEPDVDIEIDDSMANEAEAAAEAAEAAGEAAEVAEEAAEEAEGVANTAMAAAIGTGVVLGSGVAAGAAAFTEGDVAEFAEEAIGVTEDVEDEGQESDDENKKRDKGISQSKDSGPGQNEGESNAEVQQKGRFGFLSGLKDFAKEQITEAIVGGDGMDVLEEFEGDGDDEDEAKGNAGATKDGESEPREMDDAKDMKTSSRGRKS